jgi:hypothetical protein
VDDVVRGGRLLLSLAPSVAASLVLGAVVAACGGQEMGPVGISTPSPPPLESAKPAAPPPMPTAIPRDFRVHFAKLNHARFASQGHLVDRFWVDVYANDAGRALYDGKAASAPVGAMLVKDSFEHKVDGETQGPVFVMEKKEKGYDPDHGDWRWMVVTAKGEVAGDGKLQACAACHDDAPRDHVFRATE